MAKQVKPHESKKLSVFLPVFDQLTARFITEQWGAGVTINPENADIAWFTGGADVCPVLYGERTLPETRFDMSRDLHDNLVYRKLPYDMPKIGVCRGAQFLNVMNGGSLWQDVDNHTTSHPILCGLTNTTINQVVSTHHQQMIPAQNADVIATASMSTLKKGEGVQLEVGKCMDHDTEVVMYKDTKTLCFQPHPEYNHSETTTYFNLVAEYFLETVNQ